MGVYGALASGENFERLIQFLARITGCLISYFIFMQ